MKKSTSIPPKKCSLCGYATQPLYPESGGLWQRCTRKLCGHLQREAPPDSEEDYPSPVFLDYVPHAASLWGRVKGVFDSRRANEAKSRELWERLYLPETPGYFLDIGAGDLRWTEKALSYGWTAESVHTNIATVKNWQHKGLALTFGAPNWATYPGEIFDAVVLRWALEQAENPTDFIKSAWKVLKPTGRLVIVTWNSSSLGHETFGEKWLPLCIPQHRSIFSPGSLRKCVTSAGITEKFSLFSSASGQLPASSPAASPEECESLKEKALNLHEQDPLCGEALILICTKK